MTEFPVIALRSVDLVVPDLDAAQRFYADVWGLTPLAPGLFRATGPDHHVLALHQGPPAIRSITFRVADPAALHAIADRVPAAGGHVITPPHPVDWPGGGTGLVIADNQGRTLRFVTDDARHAPLPARRDRPQRLSHVNINSCDTDAATAFFAQALGFRLSDRSKLMAFVRCGPDHHTVVIADAPPGCPTNGLNHVAFHMPDLEGVMLGSGRLVDHGHPIAWGVGRHGPGDNVFAYFIDPFGIVVEYTAETLQVDDASPVHGPGHWVWPPGRTDQWGIAPPKTDTLKRAQLAIQFEATA